MRSARGRPSRALLPLLVLALGAPRPGLAEEASPSAPPPADAKRVVYIPESLKAEITEQIRKEVLAQAKAEGWAAPNVVPKWLERFTFGGDVRVRFQLISFPPGNANAGEFPDFAAINASAPFDVNFVDLSGEKYLNVDQNRDVFRLRARLGVDVNVAPGFTSGIRIASGENNSPVSTNQTLGASGGNFSKYQIWLDQAYIRAFTDPRSPSGVMGEGGRFENPFFTTRMIWAADVNFDGFAALGRVGAGDDLGFFLTGGAFPVYETALGFPTEMPSKQPSWNKWLFAGQAGGEWKPDPGLALKLAVAYYDFYGIEGRISEPCDTNLKVTCSTDQTRPSFGQKGNTYMTLRTPSDAALAAEALGPVPRYQYFGLPGAFRELAVTGNFQVQAMSALSVLANAEFVWNTAFSPATYESVALNNRAACDTAGCDRFAGGPYGFTGRIRLGSPVQGAQWSWTAGIEYRYLESDAVVDAFTDPDFGLGGTNLKGYIATGSLTLAERVTLSLLWSSASSIVGPRFQVDELLVDVMARF
jgi:hypothetical protein